VIGAWTAKDPQAVVAWLDSFSDEIRKTEALSTLAAEWCARSPQDAAKWVETRLKNPESAELAESLIDVWGNQDPVAASKWVMTLDGEIQTTSATALLYLWADVDPKLAADWAAGFPAGEMRGEAIPEIASTWAATEPEKAVAWTLSLPDSPEQVKALNEAVRSWVSVSPDSLAAWIEQQKSDDASDDLRAVASGTLIESRPQQALTLVTKISNQRLREDTLARLLNRWGSQDAAAARDWAAQAGLPPAVSARLKFPPAEEP
jgi:hypothetical protein